MIDTFYKIVVTDWQPEIQERAFPKQVNVNVIKGTVIADCTAHESVLIDIRINGTLEEVKALQPHEIKEIYDREFKRFTNMVDHDID